MTNLIRKLARPLLFVCGIGLIALAVGIGAFRLAMAQVPGYQAEIKSWAGDALGIALDFERLDARWGLAGPELTLYGARVGTPGRAPFLQARSASLTLRPWALLARRELGIRRLSFEGTRLTLFRTEDGRFRLQEAQPGAAELEFDFPPEVELVVRDSEVLYVDRARELSWQFSGVTMSLQREASRLAVQLYARPPEEFASRIELTAEGAFADGSRLGGDWRLRGDIEDVDFAVLAQSLPRAGLLPHAGRGDVTLAADVADGVVTGGSAEAVFTGLALPAERDAKTAYERLALAGEWQRLDDGWRVDLRDVQVTRDGRSWPESSRFALEVRGDATEWQSIAFSGDYLRLQDLAPLATFAPSPLAEQWLSLAPQGDVRDARLVVQRLDRDAAFEAGLPYDYEIQAELAGFGIGDPAQGPAVRQLTANVRADARSGRLDLSSRDTLVDWPGILRAQLALQELTGIVVWRQGQDAIRVVSDGLIVATPDATLNSDLELTLPRDGSSPQLDLRTAVSAFDVTAVKRYLPAGKLPPPVLAWLDRALAGGRVRAAELTLFGELAAFPFDGGEGELRAVAHVENAVLDYVADWPQAQALTGTVEFRNAAFAATGSGRVLGNRSRDVQVAIADLRRPVLTLRATTDGPLAQVLEYLHRAPAIDRHLGADFDRVTALGGAAEVSLDLALPLRDLGAFELDAELAVQNGSIAVAGFGPTVSDVNGRLVIADGAVRGEDLTATFLDGPITARVSPAERERYRARLDFDGEVTAAAVATAFELPLGERAAGQMRWQGSLLLPDPAGAQRLPALISVRSNLSGVALRFPAPFTKAPAEAATLQLDLALFRERMEMQGSLGATRRFALEFEHDDAGFRLHRGALAFGGESPELGAEQGLRIAGTLPSLDLDEWRELYRAGDAAGGVAAMPVFAGADLQIGDFAAFGQSLGSTRVSVRRRTSDWQIDVDSLPAAGTILVPADLTVQPRVIAVMQRLYLAGGRAVAASGRGIDPRQLPGLQLHSDQFGIGAHRLGRLDAEILADPLGLRLVSFESESASYRAQGSGSWLVDERGAQTTRLAASLTSTDVAATFEELGFDPIIEAERATVTASVHWPGPPAASWFEHAGGDLDLDVATGSLLDVDPGAGRVVGLLSIAALPRRLALDFREFNRGLVFDRITADFAIVDGNAFTDNLKLTGPVAEIGIVGRTGLRERDYRQQAVVMAEPGKVLPTVGGLIGGPGVAAALLIFTRIFKEPLKGIGRASYCVTGTWQAPVVERLTAEQLGSGEICAELPPATVANR